MEYKTEIAELKTELKTELKGFDCGHIGKVAGDKEGDKPKRKICLINCYEELKRIEDIQEPKDNDLKVFAKNRKPELLKEYEKYQKENIQDGLNLSEGFISWLQNIKEDSELLEEFKEENKREPLSIDREEVYKILLSWGGGSDGFKLTFQNGELLRGVYFMSDWGEYQEIELNDSEAEEVYNFYMYGDIASFKQD